MCFFLSVCVFPKDDVEVLLISKGAHTHSLTAHALPPECSLCFVWLFHEDNHYNNKCMFQSEIDDSRRMIGLWGGNVVIPTQPDSK